jgi:hypothetical protein
VTVRKKPEKKKSAVRRVARRIAKKVFGVAHQKTKEKKQMANKAVTFLENVGKMILQGLNLIPQVTQVVESSAGTPVPLLDKLSQISSVVQTAEVMIGGVMGPGSGEQKAAAAAPLIMQIVMSSELVAGRKIDPSKQTAFAAACKSLGSDVADILNCLEPDSTVVATQNLPAPAPPLGVVVPITSAAPSPSVTAAPAAPAAPAPSPAAVAIAAELSDSPGTAAAMIAGLPQD